MAPLRPVVGPPGEDVEPARPRVRWPVAAGVGFLVVAAVCAGWLVVQLRPAAAADPRVGALQAQVAALAAQVAEQPAGPQGAPGPAGRDATPGQVAAAVADWLTKHPPAAGRDGRDGRPGPAGRATAPVSWRWTDPASGRTFVCRLDPQSPPAAPAYACT